MDWNAVNWIMKAAEMTTTFFMMRPEGDAGDTAAFIRSKNDILFLQTCFLIVTPSASKMRVGCRCNQTATVECRRCHCICFPPNARARDTQFGLVPRRYATPRPIQVRSVQIRRPQDIFPVHNGSLTSILHSNHIILSAFRIPLYFFITDVMND